jgi:carbamoyl-phosphate synthase small subunit
VAVSRSESALTGTLFLEDGTRFDARGFGAVGRRVGEVVFTTGMVGYPESLTDPSFRGQILTFTYPLLGNYGVPPVEARDQFGLPTYLESKELQVRGVVVRGLARPNHWQHVHGLDRWLADAGIPGLVGVDTRTLTQHLRSQGVVRGVIDVRTAGDSPSSDELQEALRRAPRYEEENFMSEVAPARPELIPVEGGPLVAVLDCGIKASIVRALLTRGAAVLRLPPGSIIPERWEDQKIGGILVGNGPGDPAELQPTVEALRTAESLKLPMLGICLGQQLVALARGGRTFKLKYGHRGQNKTACFEDGRALIMSENHGYAVDPSSLQGSGLLPWASNPDDGTLEGLRDAEGRVLTLQGHPEGHPGPQEAGFVFDQFLEQVRRRGR